MLADGSRCVQRLQKLVVIHDICDMQHCPQGMNPSPSRPGWPWLGFYENVSIADTKCDISCNDSFTTNCNPHKWISTPLSETNPLAPLSSRILLNRHVKCKLKPTTWAILPPSCNSFWQPLALYTLWDVFVIIIWFIVHQLKGNPTWLQVAFETHPIHTRCGSWKTEFNWQRIDSTSMSGCTWSLSTNHRMCSSCTFG